MCGIDLKKIDSIKGWTFFGRKPKKSQQTTVRNRGREPINLRWKTIPAQQEVNYAQKYIYLISFRSFFSAKIFFYWLIKQRIHNSKNRHVPFAEHKYPKNNLLLIKNVENSVKFDSFCKWDGVGRVGSNDKKNGKNASKKLIRIKKCPINHSSNWLSFSHLAFAMNENVRVFQIATVFNVLFIHRSHENVQNYILIASDKGNTVFNVAWSFATVPYIPTFNKMCTQMNNFR